MADRGTRLKEALAARGIRKQQALAAELRVHESAITRWKDGKAMSLDSAVALGAVLNLSLDWLLLGRGGMDPPDGASRCGPAHERLRELVGALSPATADMLLAVFDALRRDIESPGASLR